MKADRSVGCQRRTGAPSATKRQRPRRRATNCRRGILPKSIASPLGERVVRHCGSRERAELRSDVAMFVPEIRVHRLS